MTSLVQRLYERVWGTSAAATQLEDAARNTKELVSFVTSAGQSEVGAFSHNAEDKIEFVIRSIEILKEDRRFEVGFETNLCLEDYKNATVNDFIRLIEDLPEKRAPELFHKTRLSLVKDKKPFEEAVAALRSEISECTDEKETVLISMATKRKVSTLIGTLRRLSNTTKGIFVASKHTAKAHPMLVAFCKNLEKLGQCFEKNRKKEHELNQLLLSLEEQYSQIIENQEEIFLGDELNQEANQSINQLIQHLKALIELPKILQEDDRFNPTYEQMLKKIKEVVTAFQSLVGRQEGLGTKAITPLLEKAQKIAEQSLPFLKATEREECKEATTPFHIFKAAIDEYLFKVKKILPSEQMNTLLHSLLEDCEKEREGFTKALLGEFTKKNVTVDQYYQKLIINKKKLQSAFKNALLNTEKEEELKDSSEILESLQAGSTQRHRAEQREKEKRENPISKYANDVFSYLTTLQTAIPAGTLKVLGSTFSSMLESPTIQSAIESQNPEEKKFLKSLFKEIKTLLSKAMETSDVQDYIAVFGKLKEVYKEHQIILDAIALPSLFDFESEDVENHEELTLIRKDLQATIAVETQQENWALKLEKTSKEFISNIRNYTVFHTVINGFIDLQEDNQEQAFTEIVGRVKVHTSESAQSRAFLLEMNKLVDKSNTFWAKKKAIKAFLPYVYQTISFYVEQAASSGMEHLDKLAEKLGEENGTARVRAIERVSHGASIYGEMLRHWSEVGGDKQVVLRQILGDAKYNDGMTQQELYDKFAEKAVDQFIKGSRYSKKLSLSTSKIKEWVKKPTFTQTSQFTKVLNLTLVGIKAVIGVIALAISTLAYGIAMLGEKFLNYIIRQQMKKSISRNQLVHKLVKASRENIYESNPYVHSLSKFIVEQLEVLSKTFDGVIESSPNLPDTHVQISPVVKEKLISVITNYLYALKLDSFSRASDAREYLKNKGLADDAFDKLSNLLLPTVIDSVINISTVGANSLLKKENINEKVCGLLEQLNYSLTHRTKVLTPNEKERLNRTYKETENKLNRIIEKILKQIITISVNDTVEGYGDRLTRESENLRNWIQESLLSDEKMGLVERISSSLGSYSLEEDLDRDEVFERFYELKELKDDIQIFCDELEHKISTFENNSNDRSIKKFHEQLVPLSKALKEAISDNALTNIYRYHERLTYNIQDLDIIDTLKTRFEAIKRNLCAATEDPRSSKIKNLQANTDLIKSLLMKLNTDDPENEEPAVLKREIYQELKEQVFLNKEFKQTFGDHLNEFSHLFSVRKTLSNPRLEAVIEEIVKLKKSRSTTSSERSIKSLTHKIEEQLKTLDFLLKDHKTDQIVARVISITKEIVKDTLSLDQTKQRHESLKKLIKNETDSLSTKLSTKKDSILKTHEMAEKLILEASTNLHMSVGESIKKAEEARVNCLSKLANLQTSAEQMQKLEFKRINIGVVDRLKKVTSKKVYDVVKPMLSLSLIRKETFYNTMLNHVPIQLFVN